MRRMQLRGLNDQGLLFNVITDISIPSATSVRIQVKTGSKAVYVVDRLVSHTSTQLESLFYEDPATITDGSTVIPSRTLNRNFSTSPEVVLYSDPTGVTGGLEIERVRSFGNGLGTVRNVIADIGNELILKTNTDYVLQITNLGANTAQVYSAYTFYEM